MVATVCLPTYISGIHKYPPCWHINGWYGEIITGQFYLWTGVICETLKCHILPIIHIRSDFVVSLMTYNHIHNRWQVMTSPPYNYSNISTISNTIPVEYRSGRGETAGSSHTQGHPPKTVYIYAYTCI
jgi:hypothetical protein